MIPKVGNEVVTIDAASDGQHVAGATGGPAGCAGLPRLVACRVRLCHLLRCAGESDSSPVDGLRVLGPTGMKGLGRWDGVPFTQRRDHHMEITLMPEVFINYRVGEQAGYAVLLDRELAARFGTAAVFRAPRSIQPGDDFAREILRNLRTCTVLLAVIGPDWVAVGRRPRRVVGGEADWVHREIAEALARRIRVIPILVEGGSMPAEDDLPADIAPLARCQYLRLNEHSIDDDIAHVARAVGRLIPVRPDQDHLREVPHTEVRLYRLAAAARPSVAPRIGVITGTILRVRCADIWVNSENTDMEMSRFTEFSVSGIIRYWGAERDPSGRVTADLIANGLAAAVGDRRPVAPGSVFVTGAGALTASNNVRHVIHVAAVQGEPGSGFRQVRRVGQCVTNALIEAERLTRAGRPARTILFPLLGVGVAGAELTSTVQTLLDAAVNYLIATATTTLSTIYFLAYTDLELAALDAILCASPHLVPVDRPRTINGQ
jgi:O-acetyl-ADP-ribose deacetylase (regulator of RNase III)